MTTLSRYFAQKTKTKVSLLSLRCAYRHKILPTTFFGTKFFILSKFYNFNEDSSGKHCIHWWCVEMHTHIAVWILEWITRSLSLQMDGRGGSPRRAPASATSRSNYFREGESSHGDSSWDINVLKTCYHWYWLFQGFSYFLQKLLNQSTDSLKIDLTKIAHIENCKSMLPLQKTTFCQFKIVNVICNISVFQYSFNISGRNKTH